MKQPVTSVPARNGGGPSSSDDRAARDAALELGPNAQLIVARDGRLVFANRAARALLELADDALDRPFAQAQPAHWPIDLLDAIERALRERAPIRLGEAGYGPRRLEVTVTPLPSAGEEPSGVSIGFEDVTLRAELELACGQLQSAIDELEATDEELRAAGAELRATAQALAALGEELRALRRSP